MSCPIYLVDDDPTIIESVTWLLEGENYIVKSYSSGKLILDDVDKTKPGVVVLDINMPGMNGMEVQKELACNSSCLSIIFLTGHADVSITKTAFKQGAMELLEKPLDGDLLLGSIDKAIELSEANFKSKQHSNDIKARLDSLTDREKAFIPLIMQGLTNKQIASELCIALRTAEIHRHNMFKKMGVSSGIQLALLGRLIEPFLE